MSNSMDDMAEEDTIDSTNNHHIASPNHCTDNSYHSTESDKDLAESLNNHTQGLTLDASCESSPATSNKSEDMSDQKDQKENDEIVDDEMNKEVNCAGSAIATVEIFDDEMHDCDKMELKSDKYKAADNKSQSDSDNKNPDDDKTENHPNNDKNLDKTIAESCDTGTINDSGICLNNTSVSNSVLGESNARLESVNEGSESQDDDIDSIRVEPGNDSDDLENSDDSYEDALNIVPQRNNHQKDSTNTSGVDHRSMPVNYDTDDSGPWDSYDVTVPDEPGHQEENDSDQDDGDIPVSLTRRMRRKRRHENLPSDSDNDDMADADSEGKLSSDSADEEDEQMSKLRHNWFPLSDIMQREFGVMNNQQYVTNVCASLNMTQRFKLQAKMDYHEGCVNCLHFNDTGTFLSSGSDDLRVCIWDWVRHRKYITFDSGHRSNVFQCKFMPHSGDLMMVTSARDGQVRLAELSATKRCKSTRKLAQHRGAAHKLSVHPDCAHAFLSCGEDAVTYEIDVREEKPNKLCITKENNKKVALYSIQHNPGNQYEYCVGGRDHFVRIYDKRKVSAENDEVLKKFCPSNLVDSQYKANVTCAVYNYNGTEIIGSYNDEDIYLFDTSHSDGAEHTHRYTGHRNNATVKGVNFYGPHSEYIVSGSDCGHLFLWDKQTEQIVQYLEGDEGGVINVLEPHPNLPYIATSGLDHDVKIWAPTATEPTRLEGLKRATKRNKKEREEERTHDGEVDEQMLWFFMQHLRRSARRRARETGEISDSQSDSDNSDSDHDSHPDEDNDDDEGAARMRCTPS